MRHIGGAVGAVQRELELLTASGLVRREVRGKQVYFQANQKAAIFPELLAGVAEKPSQHAPPRATEQDGGRVEGRRSCPQDGDKRIQNGNTRSTMVNTGPFGRADTAAALLYGSRSERLNTFARW